MSTNASTSASASGSSAGHQPQGILSPTPTEAGEGRYVLSTDSDDELMGMGIPDLSSETDSLPPLTQPPNLLPTMPSFILNPLPILMLNQKSNTPSKESPDLTLSSTISAIQFSPHVKEGVAAGEGEKEEENKLPPSLHPSTLKMPIKHQQNNRLPPLMPVETWIDCTSALCVNWTAISPETAQATFVSNASTMCLDISLQGVQSRDGLHNFHMEGLVQIVVLCQTIMIMMMTGTTIMTENDDRTFIVNTEQEHREFMFIEVNPKKPEASLAQPAMEEEEMVGLTPDESQEYDTELYGDGES
ncbi:hypothetical protein Moror_9047 [Moniliophthora roreri MCA 2997]|uniref:Uncharacterized protein n=1 Tax=Moniliophthora roreri (strain MCA 2997) TaxID=1381753 RepID=V2XGQ4_MONRO|nr:hypothetical protein Moror_9047 [Moniliophthora roreri MCA 2997]